MTTHWIDTALAFPKKYLGKYIVYNDSNIYFSSESVIEANQWLKEHRDEYDTLHCFFLSKSFFGKKILSIRLKSLRKESWTPKKEISFLKEDGNSILLEILIDSGADTTFIPYQFGIEIGLSHNRGDVTKTAYGVGSQISYLEKLITIGFDNRLLEIPICWCLDEQIDDILLGREGIFEYFKVIFDEQQNAVIFEPYQNE